MGCNRESRRVSPQIRDHFPAPNLAGGDAQAATVELLSKPPRCWIRFAHRRKPQGCQSRSWSWPDSPLEGTGFEPSVPPFRSGVPAPTAGAVRRGLFAGAKRIRTISPTVAFRSWRWSGRETSAAESLSFSRGTNGSNPLCSSGESVSPGITTAAPEKSRGWSRSWSR